MLPFGGGRYQAHQNANTTRYKSVDSGALQTNVRPPSRCCPRTRSSCRACARQQPPWRLHAALARLFRGKLLLYLPALGCTRRLDQAKARAQCVCLQV
jgi:hypothetical protein